MKKSLILFLAFLVVGALAFAAEPTAELKIAEFTGDASVTLGFDIDQGMAAFTNEANADIKIQIAGSGDKTTAGEGIWGELKIKTDGDPVGIKLKGTKLSDYTGTTVVAGDPFYGYKVVVDKAQLNFGTIAYLGIKSDGSQLDYVDLMDEAAGFYKVNTAKYYGTLADTGDAGTLVDDLAISVATDVNATYGVVLGITPAGIGTFTVDFRSLNKWLADGVPQANNWGLRVKADITAVTNLSVKLGATYSIGVTDAITEVAGAADIAYVNPRDLGFGGYISYKIPLGDPMYVMPIVAADAQYVMRDPALDPDASINIEAEAGVRLGWGDKSKLNMFFSPDNDTDWGYYPGITAGVRFSDTDLGDALGGVTDPVVGLNVSVFTGALVPNLAANVAFEIMNLMVEAPAGMQMGFSANVKYDLAMDPMTVTPKFGLSYYSDATEGLADIAATDIYVKAGLDIAKIFPNTTLSFLYQSNDFNGGVVRAGDVTLEDHTIGMFATTLKIAF